jgi:hypothetical protein
LLNLGDVLRAFKIYAAQAERAIHKMDMAIDEPRQYQLARGIDYFGIWTAKPPDGGIVADSDDFIRANRQGLRPRLLGVQRINAAMNYDGVGNILGFFFLRGQEHD